MRFVCATHGHCFDGMASAVVFTRLLRTVTPEAVVEYRACGYGANQPKADASSLVGEQNALLDFRFGDLPQLGWYFDHHKTAFPTPADEAAFAARQAREPERFFYDAAYTSCTKLIADVAKSRFGLVFDDLAPLVEWADVIDAARFPNAAAAVDRSNPVMQLAAVVEHYGDDRFLAKAVPELLAEPLTKVAQSRLVTGKYKALGEKHDRFTARVRERGQLQGRVVHVDLTDGPVDAVAKFATYAMYPEAMYSVVVGLLSGGVKISVGYNPWCGAPRDMDVSAICSRFGGGGHPVVGGIAFPRSEVDRARTIARQIADELA
jgi:hypothetical protein